MNTGLSVSVSSLSVKFGDFFAVKDVSFNVARGEIFGFLGANGAGKTTTIRVLCGVLPPTSGSISVNGHDYSDVNSLKSQIGYMSQKFTLYDDLTVYENLSFNAGLRKIPGDLFKQRMEELLGFIEFDRPLNTLVHDLPGGIKQQVSLVVSLLHDPDVVFLDEPTAGVTPYYRDRFWRLIRLLSSRNKTIFVTTHYMDEAEQCHRIALMRTGEMIALDTPLMLKRNVFPEPLIELDQFSHEFDIKLFKSFPGVLSALPYGSRYHAIVKDKETVQRLQEEFGSKAVLRQITPSLEDVFVRLVEGDR